MSVTDLALANLHDRRIVGSVDLRDRVVSYLKTAMLRHTKARLTGPTPDADPGGWFTSVTVTDGTGANCLDIAGGDGGVYGTDGTGELISVENGDERIDEVPFEDAPATTYYMAVQTCDVPEGISFDTAAEVIQYDRHRKEIGHLAEPTAAVASGSGVELTLGNHQLDASDDFTGRTAVVYLKAPVSPSAAVAIEEVVIVGATVTTVGALGQSVVSTTASDYEVVIVGLTITRSNSVQSAAGWAYIGTVVGGGAPRTYDFSDQPALVSLEELSEQSSRLLRKGWLTLPSVGLGGTTATVAAGGVVFVNGRAREVSAPSSALDPTDSSEFWITWNDGASAYEIATTWDDANAAGSVPVYWGVTDGTGAITGQLIGRLVEEFPEQIVMTVSEDSDHKAAFRTLEGALAAARSIQAGAGITPPGIVIEIVGDVTVTAAIADQNLYAAQNITIRGRGSRWAAAGSRIVWDFDGSLFALTTATMAGWRFEDIAFVCEATVTDATAALISVTGTASVSDLVFYRCFIDGSPSVGAGGTLPNAIYCSASSVAARLTGIALIECKFWTTDTIIQIVAGSRAMSDVRVDKCTLTVAGASVGGVVGGIVDSATTGVSTNWRVSDSDIATPGSCLLAYSAARWRIHDCRLRHTSGDAPAIDLGNVTTYAVSAIWVHDCELDSSILPATVAVVRIRAQNTNGVNPPGIFVHSNLFTGAGPAASDAGILFECGGTDLDGVSWHSNTFVSIGTGVIYNSTGAGRITGPVGMGNHIHAGAAGVRVTDVVEPVHVGNYTEVENAAGVGFDVNAAGVLAANAVVMGDATGTGIDLAATVDEAIVGLNRITGSDTPITVGGGDKNILVGNAATKTGSIVGVAAGAQYTAIMGNQFDGLDLDGAGTLGIGNRVADTIDYAGVNTKLIGNRVASIVGADGTDRSALIGNHCEASIVPGASDGVTMVGNWVALGAAYSLNLTNSALVGNVVEATTFELGATSADVALVGNRIADQTIGDAGTNNVVANNT